METLCTVSPGRLTSEVQLTPDSSNLQGKLRFELLGVENK